MLRTGILRFCFLFLALLCFHDRLAAQQVLTPVPGSPVTALNAPQRDTSKKTNDSDWKDEKAQIHFTKLNSVVRYYPDTSIHFFHRRPFTQPWQRDLGNPGSPSINLFFTPEYRTGPTLGYHGFDIYRFQMDSLSYYNTTRPYSVFSYNLGSKAEQVASILHTQNIRPNWNFAVQYRKINAPGYYRIQRNNDDFGNLTTNYNSRNQHYRLNAAFVYNKVQHDENGGIIADTFLTNESFGDRRTVPVTFQDDQFSIRRSAVTTLFRDWGILLQHGYTWGRTDTLYNEDSTQYSAKLTPRFSVTHRFRFSAEKYQYKDVRPDSLRYLGLFQEGFASGDSVFTEQKWVYVDNALMLNGFIGGAENPLLFMAGIGNRVDKFRNETGTEGDKDEIISNYLTGEIRKEALNPGEWFYQAKADFYLTGNAAGNFHIRADLGKDLSRFGRLSAGFSQQLNNAPYNFTFFKNEFYVQSRGYDKESITLLHAALQSSRLRLGAGVRSYIIGNYIYLDANNQFSQDAGTFNVSQIWLQKMFKFGIWVLDNELAYQQKTGNAPVNVPALMGRHQLSIETLLFDDALKIATGIDIRWHTAYEPSGYNPFFNRFYYQSNYQLSNRPEAAVFFNFKIKSFRAFLMGDQLQQFFGRNTIASPGYPLQDAMIRFGFNWVMIN